MASTQAAADGLSSRDLDPPTGILLNVVAGYRLRAAGAQENFSDVFISNSPNISLFAPNISHLAPNISLLAPNISHLAQILAKLAI